MYKIEILYGITDAHGKEFERVLESTGLLSSGDDLDKAKAEAETYSLWNEHVASYHAAVPAGELPEWKQHNVKGKRVHEMKYTKRPPTEVHGQYVIVRISKV